MRKIIQFGTKHNDLIIFPHGTTTANDYQDAWNFEKETSLLELQFADGSYRYNGFDRSRIKTKSISKTFSINFTNVRNEIITKYITQLNRVCGGGVKKLIAEREDKSMVWTWAEAVNVNYSKGDDDPNWLSYSIDFIAHCPFWYTFRYGEIAFWNVNNIVDYFDVCENTDISKFEYLPCRDICCECSDCSLQNEMIIEDVNWGNSKELQNYGKFDSIMGYSVCGTGSATSGIDITFKDKWTNPKAVFGANSIEYAGALVNGQYLHLKTYDQRGRKDNMLVYTNIPAFNTNNLTLVGGEFTGNVTVTLSGSTGGTASVNVIDKHYN